MRIYHPLTIVSVLTSILLAHAQPALALEAEAVPGEYLVKLKVPVKKENLQELEQKLGAPIENVIARHRIVRIQKPKIQLPDIVIQSLEENPIVAVAEQNFIYRINKTPNDPSFFKLWGLKNTGQSDSKSEGIAGIDIDAERAWDITTGSNDVLVAVIDTGVAENHSDLSGNMWINEPEAKGEVGIDDDGNGYVDDIHGYNFVEAEKPTSVSMDDHGHGSHCAGTIGGYGDDGKGIVGVAWNVKIMAVKFLGADGGGTLEGAIEAIDYAIKNGAKILSNSWGGGGESQLLKEAIQRSHDAGALFVAAAGNDSMNNDSSAHYPSNYEVPNVLAVAAIDNKGNLAGFSNFGKKTVHVAAPGVNIFSSVTENGYATWSGTSMATPHVAGVAALLAANEPEMTSLEIKERIINTVKPIAALRNKVISKGMANAYFALTNQIAPPDLNDPVYWESKPLAISTEHPYAKTTSETFEVSVEGAKEIALYFERFDTEKGYDKVTLYNRAGESVAVLSGTMDDSHSPVIPGDYVKLVFTSDDSVERYGFDLTKVSYR